MNKFGFSVAAMALMPFWALANTDSFKNHVLYAQDSGNGRTGVVSQLFDSDYSQYDSQSADDFVVPKGQTWVVKQVAASGAYFDGQGPATSENVFFYYDNHGSPGASVPGSTFLNEAGSDFAGSFNVLLPGKGLKLHRGRYWVSVQANMPYNLGWWGWFTQSLPKGQGGRPAVWQNPSNGYGTGCLAYTVETQCWPQVQGAAKVFIIYGAEK
jgi:hypothetical protein